jgi:DNA-binding transcriptional MerR regulator
MKISEVATRAGVTPDTIRYYERLGLLEPATRMANGYRDYPESAVRRIVLIRNAVRFGFSLKDLTSFLQARDTSQPPCQQVRASAQRLLDDVDRQIADLVTARANMRRTLKDWDARLRAIRPGAPARLLDVLPTVEHSSRRSATRMTALRKRRP